VKSNKKGPDFSGPVELYRTAVPYSGRRGYFFFFGAAFFFAGFAAFLVAFFID
jgi:hypothetical protein